MWAAFISQPSCVGGPMPRGALFFEFHLALPTAACPNPLPVGTNRSRLPCQCASFFRRPNGQPAGLNPSTSEPPWGSAIPGEGNQPPLTAGNLRQLSQTLPHLQTQQQGCGSCNDKAAAEPCSLSALKCPSMATARERNAMRVVYFQRMEDMTAKKFPSLLHSSWKSSHDSVENVSFSSLRH